MPFQPKPGDRLTANGTPYLFAEDPGTPGAALMRRGQQSIVYQLLVEGQGLDGARALKVFDPRYRAPRLMALNDRFIGLSRIPGLRAAERVVFSLRTHSDLLRVQPDLNYAILMPWIEGPSWAGILQRGQLLTPAGSLSLAHSLAEVLNGMEEQGVAHCDLSSANVLLPGMDEVELIDLEQLYAPGLERPIMYPAGTPGYVPPGAEEAVWSPEADRFGGGILMSEILASSDPRFWEMAAGNGSFFDGQELQADTDRYACMRVALRDRWGKGVSSLFNRVWRSETAAEAPTFGEWLSVLPQSAPDTLVTAETPAMPDEPATPREAVLRELMAVALKLEDEGNVPAALTVYRHAQSLGPTDPELNEDLARMIRSAETRQPTLPTRVIGRYPPAVPMAPAKPEQSVELEPTPAEAAPPPPMMPPPTPPPTWDQGPTIPTPIIAPPAEPTLPPPPVWEQRTPLPG